MNAKVDGLKFDNVEDGWNNFRKIICEVANGVLGKKVRNATRNINEKALCFIERRRGLCKNYLSYTTTTNTTTNNSLQHQAA